MAKTPRNPKLVVPAATALCPCGSGDSFASCCDPHLPGVMTVGVAIEAARRNNDVAAGLIAARADLAAWTIFHRTNTAPVMQAGIIAISPLVMSDIENICDFAERVAELMVLSGQGDQVGAMFERLRGHIDDPRWSRRVTFLHALHARKLDDVAGARREFSKLGVIDEAETDVRILRMAIDLNESEALLNQGLRLFERMLCLSDTLEDQMRYRGLKAAYYIVHHDKDQARRELQAAIDLVDERDDAELSYDEADCLIWCLSHLALMTREPGLFERADRILQAWLAKPKLHRLTIAEIHKMRGDLLRFAGAAAAAEEAYRSVLEHQESAIASIFLGEVLLAQEKLPQADQVLRSVEPAHLAPNEYEDYLFVSSTIAIHLGDRAALRQAEARLRQARGTAPYFEQRRLAFLVAVGDAITNGATQTLGAKVRRLLADPAAVFNRYVEVKPGFGPFKLNLNKVLEDALEDGQSVRPAKPRSRIV